MLTYINQEAKKYFQYSSSSIVDIRDLVMDIPFNHIVKICFKFLYIDRN